MYFGQNATMAFYFLGLILPVLICFANIICHLSIDVDWDPKWVPMKWPKDYFMLIDPHQSEVSSKKKEV